MNFTITASLYGQKQFMRTIRTWRDDKVKQISKAINSSAMKVRNGAVRRCPSNFSRLRASIRIRYYPNGLAADIYTNVDYAAFVEFGTGPKGKNTSVKIRTISKGGLTDFVEYRFELPPGYKYGTKHKLPVKKIGSKFFVVEPLALWALRHKADPMEVAYAIKKRGGNPAKPFIGPAFQEEVPHFMAKLEQIMR